MKRKIIIMMIILFTPVLLFSQAKKEEPAKVTGEKKSKKPVQAIKTDIFTINKHSFTFNKHGDNLGRGEILEVHFEIFNNTDLKRNLYMYVVGTYEETSWLMNSFNTRKMRPEKISISLFESYPRHLENFQYDLDGEKTYIKFPIDPKKGVNPDTGKPFVLDDRLFVRAKLLSKYRKKYKFFNHVTIMVFDDKGKSIFRQVYSLDGRRK